MQADISQAFLRNPIETGGEAQRNGFARTRLGESGFDTGAFHKLVDIALKRHDQPEIVHRGLVKPVCELTDIVRQLAHMPADRSDPAANGDRRFRKVPA